MKTAVKLVHDRGFVWHHGGGIHAKGCFHSGNGDLHRGETLLPFFQGIQDPARFRERIHEANGSFAVVVETEGHVFAAVDSVCAFPLFYGGHGGRFFLSDDVAAIRSEIGKIGPDPVQREAFLRLGYTIGPETLDPRISQLEAGEFLVLDKARGVWETGVHFSHEHGEYDRRNEDELVAELDLLTGRWTRRLIASARGRTIVVALSGGYDSRSIVCALKREGYSDVICYSYGLPESPERRIAFQTADRLGYPVHLVDYGKANWRALLASPLFLEFCRYAFRQSGVPCLQELPAMDFLCGKGLIPRDAVIVPGYCGDVHGGSYVPAEAKTRRAGQLLARGIDDFIVTTFFNLNNTPFPKDVRKGTLQKIHAFTGGFRSETMEEFCSVLENWLIRHRVSRFVINTVRTFEHFGLEWRLPLWDLELITWWNRIPLDLRIDSALYHRFLFDRLFKPLHVDFPKPEPRRTNSFVKTYILSKGLRKRLMPLLGRSAARFQAKAFDPNGFQAASEVLIDRMDAGWKLEDFKNINGVMSAWSLESLV